MAFSRARAFTDIKVKLWEPHEQGYRNGKWYTRNVVIENVLKTCAHPPNASSAAGIVQSLSNSQQESAVCSPKEVQIDFPWFTKLYLTSIKCIISFSNKSISVSDSSWLYNMSAYCKYPIFPLCIIHQKKRALLLHQCLCFHQWQKVHSVQCLL